MIKTMKISKILLSALLVCIMAIAQFSLPTCALEPGDIVMSLTPSEQDIELTPGQTYSGSVVITNVGRLPYSVKASVSPYYVAGDDYTPDFENESAYTKLHNWVELDQTEYQLEPGDKANVDFTITVPKDVASGGQYAAIMLLSNNKGSGEGVNVQAQLAAILYGHVSGGELRREGELVNHSLPNFMFNSDFVISQTVKNTGNIDFRVTQKMTVTNFFTNKEIINENTVSSDGDLVGSNTATVLPGTSRTGILRWDNAPKLGVFRVTQDISFLDQSYSFSQVVLICPIWLFVALIALFIVAIIWIILHFVKKSHSSPQVLR